MNGAGEHIRKLCSGLVFVLIALTASAQQSPSSPGGALPGITSQSVLDLPKAAQDQITREQSQPQNNAREGKKATATVGNTGRTRHGRGGELFNQGGS